jgi:flagellar motor switch protein FliG
MSETVSLHDLELLDAADLRAVLEQLEPSQLIAAFWGIDAGLRGRLLKSLPRRYGSELEAALHDSTQPTLTCVRQAQQELVAVLCRMSRAGQIAFDVVEDMVA